MDDKELLHRLERTPDRQIFHIDCWNISNEQAEKYVKDFRQKLKDKGFDSGEVIEDTYEE